MKNESRVIVTNVSEAGALELVQHIRKTNFAKGAKIEIDNPDPPDLLEDEFSTVDNAFGKIWELVEGVDWPGSECDTLAKVNREIKGLRTLTEKVWKAYNYLLKSMNDLEAAAAILADIAKLPKK